MSDFYRVKIGFDGYENTFLSTDTYSSDRARALVERIADQLGPDSWVELEATYTEDCVFGRAVPSNGTDGGTK